MNTIKAFPRADGSVGIRNIVLVISTVTCANTVTSHIAWKTGAVPLTHERGCVEGEQSYLRTMLALSTFAKHPNVAGVLIVGLGCEQIQALDLRYFPTHNLYNPAKRCTVRTRSLAVLVRATLFQPKLIILNGTFEDLDAKDTEIVWGQVPKICGPDTCFLYLSSTPIPQQFSWTRQLRI